MATIEIKTKFDINDVVYCDCKPYVIKGIDVLRKTYESGYYDTTIQYQCVNQNSIDKYDKVAYGAKCEMLNEHQLMTKDEMLDKVVDVYSKNGLWGDLVKIAFESKKSVDGVQQ